MNVAFNIFLTVFAIFCIVAMFALYLPIIRKKAFSKTERAKKIALISVLVLVIVGILFTLVASFLGLF